MPKKRPQFRRRAESSDEDEASTVTAATAATTTASTATTETTLTAGSISAKRAERKKLKKDKVKKLKPSAASSSLSFLGDDDIGDTGAFGEGSGDPVFKIKKSKASRRMARGMELDVLGSGMELDVPADDGSAGGAIGGAASSG